MLPQQNSAQKLIPQFAQGYKDLCFSYERDGFGFFMGGNPPYERGAVTEIRKIPLFKKGCKTLSRLRSEPGGNLFF